MGNDWHLHESDWIRFQLQRPNDKRVLEGYIQEISSDGRQLKIGKEPDGAEFDSFARDEIVVLKAQSLGALV